LKRIKFKVIFKKVSKLPYLIVEKKWQVTLYKNLFYFN